MFYGFANDDWHIKKNFSINLGLRYEFTQVPLSQRKWQPLNAISNVPGLITFGAPKAQKKNFLPRIGFAWSPGSEGNTSIRGGYSMSTDVLFDNLGLLSAAPQVQQTCDAAAGTPPEDMTATCFWSDPTTDTGGFLANGGLPFSATIPPIATAEEARAVTSGYIPDQKLPYSETWTLGIQHIFAKKYTVEVRYVGTRGIHLPVQNRLNRQSRTSATEFLPTYLSDPGQAALDALTNTYNQINAKPNFVPAYADAGFVGANVLGFMPYGASKYHGLQTQVNRSFTNGLQFQAAWTWSHLMDDSTAEVFSTYLTPRREQDFQCVKCDWSNSALDRRHRFTLQLMYDVPFLKHDSNWFKKNVVGNWEVGTLYTFQSPEFATVQSGVDVNGNGDSAGDRTIINPAGVHGTGTGVTSLFNTAGDRVAYLATDPTAYYIATGKYGMATARRNTLAMPHTNNIDFSVVKRFNITESQNFEFHAQALNVLNHAQYLPGYISDVQPQGFTGSDVLTMLIPGTQSFNQPKSVFTNHPRQLVLVLKYNF